MVKEVNEAGNSVKTGKVTDDVHDEGEDVSGDESDVRDVDEIAKDGPNSHAPALLSKSWSIASSHVPTFTGGTVTACKNHNWLLLPVHGDLAVVDATIGTKISSLRGNESTRGGEQGEDDEGLDHEAITSYAIDNNDQMILTCTRNLLLQQYSLDSIGNTKLVKVWGKAGHTLPVTCMSFHMSNVFFATGSVDGSVRVWDVRGAYVTHVFRPFAGGDGGGSGRLSVTAISWRQQLDQLVLAIARDDGSMTVHNLRDTNDECVVVLRDHVSAVTCMEWWGEEFFLSTGRDAMLNLWRIVPVENTSKKDKKAKQKKSVRNGVPSANEVQKVEYRRIQSIPTYEQIEGMVTLHSTKHPSEIRVATAGSKGSARLWKATVVQGETPQLKLNIEQPAHEAFGDSRGGFMGLVLNHRALADKNKKEQLIAVDAEHNLTFLSSKLLIHRTLVGHNDEILDLKTIPGDSNSIVVATNSPQIRLFSLADFSCNVLDGHTATVLCVAASPCGRYVASCGKDKTFRLWRLLDRKCVAIATGHTEPIGACGLSSKVGRYEVTGKASKNGGGAFCVTASVDRTLKRWNMPGLDELTNCGENPIEMEAASSVRGHDKDINIVTIAPNDSLVASGSQDKTIKLWSATDLSLRATLKGHRRGVWDCQFSPIDRVLASSSGDKTVKLWSLSDYSCVRTFQGHLSSVLRVRFLKTGLQLVTAGADGLIKLWTIRTNECEATLDGHSDKVWALDMSPTGQTFVSGGADSTLTVWKDNTIEVEEEKRANEAATILLDQQLANHLRHKEYGKALEVALKVDKPLQALRVINSIIEEEIQQGKGNGLSALQQTAKSWDMERVTKVLKYCRDWNTRARNATAAMLVVQAIVTVFPVEKLSGVAGISDIMKGITPYAVRHFERLDRLYTSSYLLDFTLTNMGDFDPAAMDTDSAVTFANWENSSKLVLPPKFVDGRIQVGGKTVVGRATVSNDENSEGEDDEVHTIGDSSTDQSIIDHDPNDDVSESSESEDVNMDDNDDNDDKESEDIDTDSETSET